MINLDAKKLYEFYRSKNINYFYHANSVATSCSFIEIGGLLSRESTIRKKLLITSQDSDDIDKKYNVFNDIFLDVFDLHGYFPRENAYGPITFVIDNSFLLDDKLPNICITKDNPIYWKASHSIVQRYYSSIDEYKNEFEYNLANKSIQRKMLTIHDTDKKLPFKKYLKKIIIDNPNISMQKIDLYNFAKSEIYNSLKKTLFCEDIVEERKCINCFCCKNYHNYDSIKLKRLFLINS